MDGGAVALDRAKLARVLGLLGSRHPGEVAAAARQAERMRIKAGATWIEILAPQMPPAASRDGPGADWRNESPHGRLLSRVPIPAHRLGTSLHVRRA